MSWWFDVPYPQLSKFETLRSKPRTAIIMATNANETKLAIRLDGGVLASAYISNSDRTQRKGKARPFMNLVLTELFTTTILRPLFSDSKSAVPWLKMAIIKASPEVICFDYQIMMATTTFFIRNLILIFTAVAWHIWPEHDLLSVALRVVQFRHWFWSCSLGFLASAQFGRWLSEPPHQCVSMGLSRAMLAKQNV